jgi:hypothetical protein
MPGRPEQERWLRRSRRPRRPPLASGAAPFLLRSAWQRCRLSGPLAGALRRRHDIVLSRHPHLRTPRRSRPRSSGSAGRPAPVHGRHRRCNPDRLRDPARQQRVRQNSTFGVLEMTLQADGYAWRYWPVSTVSRRRFRGLPLAQAAGAAELCRALQRHLAGPTRRPPLSAQPVVSPVGNSGALPCARRTGRSRCASSTGATATDFSGVGVGYSRLDTELITDT